MSLASAYCENFRRSPPLAFALASLKEKPLVEKVSLWGLKNNQTRKERFFRWFLTFVVIKSNLDAFALTANKLATKGFDFQYIQRYVSLIHMYLL
jgi:hypothetical protein